MPHDCRARRRLRQVLLTDVDFYIGHFLAQRLAGCLGLVLCWYISSASSPSNWIWSRSRVSCDVLKKPCLGNHLAQRLQLASDVPKFDPRLRELKNLSGDAVYVDTQFGEALAKLGFGSGHAIALRLQFSFEANSFSRRRVASARFSPLRASRRFS